MQRIQNVNFHKSFNNFVMSIFSPMWPHVNGDEQNLAKSKILNFTIGLTKLWWRPSLGVEMHLGGIWGVISEKMAPC